MTSKSDLNSTPRSDKMQKMYMNFQEIGFGTVRCRWVHIGKWNCTALRGWKENKPLEKVMLLTYSFAYKLSNEYSIHEVSADGVETYVFDDRYTDEGQIGGR